MVNLVGVLLAGGKSRRFGRPKAFVEYDGRAFWKYSYNAIKEETDSQVIISHPDLVDQFENTSQVLTDEEFVMGKGPLAGIYTAMKHVKAEWYVVLSCDIPLITKQTIHRLLDFRNPNVKAIIPNVNKKLHPLVGVYHHSLFKLLEKNLKNDNLKMLSLFEQIEVKYVSEKDLGVHPRIFCNINSQEDYIDLLTNDKIAES